MIYLTSLEIFFFFAEICRANLMSIQVDFVEKKVISAAH